MDGQPPTPKVSSPSGHLLSPTRSSTPAVDLSDLDVSFELEDDEGERRQRALARHLEGPAAEKVRRQVASEEVTRAIQQAREEIPR